MAAYLAAFCAGAGRYIGFLGGVLIHEYPEVQTIETQKTIWNTFKHFVPLIVQIICMLE